MENAKENKRKTSHPTLTPIKTTVQSVCGDEFPLNPIKTDVYTLSYKVYQKMPKAAVKRLYEDYIILGVREWATAGHLVLIKKGACPDYE